MKKRFFSLIAVMVSICPMLTGCSVNSIILGCGGGCGEPQRHEKEIRKPLTGTTDIYQSKYKLRITDRNSTQGIILDDSGKEIGRISCPQQIYDISCRYGVFLLTTRSSPEDKAIERIYRYKPGDTKCSLLADRVLSISESGMPVIQDNEIPGVSKITQNDKLPITPVYLVCKENPANPPKNYSDYRMERDRTPSKIIMLDPQNNLEPVFSTGTYCIDYRVYPYGSRILYLELSKDEFGDYSNYSLKVTDIPKKKTFNIITTRRKPEYRWCGNNTIAVFTYDKYKKPTLSLFSLDTGKLTRLVTEQNASAIELVNYDASTGNIVYKTYPTSSQVNSSAEWWSIYPDKKPSRLPMQNFPVMPGMMAGPGMPEGMPMPGMPGSIPPGIPQMPPPYSRK